MEKAIKDIFSKFDVQCLEKLPELHNDLLFIPERMKTKKVSKLVTNLKDLYDVIHIRHLKHALTHVLMELTWTNFEKSSQSD